jgi:hypothetical protein
MARYVTRAELSRLAGVSDAAITKACRNTLLAACEGKRVDVDHPSVVAYLKGKGRKPPKFGAAPTSPSAVRARAPSVLLTARPRSADSPSLTPHPGSDDDLEQLADLIRPLLERFGTEQRFKDFLASLKTIEEIRGKRLDNEENEGRLIERELVSKHVFSALESLHKRLLTDVVATITQRLYGAVKSGVPLEEAKQMVRDIISAQLKPVKTTAARVLRNA